MAEGEGNLDYILAGTEQGVDSGAGIAAIAREAGLVAIVQGVVPVVQGKGAPICTIQEVIRCRVRLFGGTRELGTAGDFMRTHPCWVGTIHWQIPHAHTRFELNGKMGTQNNSKVVFFFAETTAAEKGAHDQHKILGSRYETGRLGVGAECS